MTKSIQYAAIVALSVLAFVGCVTTDWNAATQQNTAASYKEYLEKHPSSEFDGTARRRLEDAVYRQAKIEDTVESYSGYLAQYPAGQYIAVATNRITELRTQAREAEASNAYNRVSDSSSISMLTDVVSSYRGTRAALLAAKRRNMLRHPLIQPVDLRSGITWKYPITGKQMVYVPTMVITPDTNIICRSFGLWIQFADKNSRPVCGALPWVESSTPFFVSGFFIDQANVSNADYARYVDDTGCPYPESWSGARPTGTNLAADADVTVQEAQSYAEWAGLRLPVFHQMNAAMSATNGVYPWCASNPCPPSKSSCDSDSSPHGVHGIWSGRPAWTEGYVRMREAMRGTLGLLKYWPSTINGEYIHFVMPKDNSGTGPFRCVYPWASLISVATQTQADERQLPGASTNIPMATLTVSNSLATTAMLLFSDGQKLAVDAYSTAKRDIPIGTYTVLLTTQGSISRRGYDVMFQSAGGWPERGMDQAWTITEDFGDVLYADNFKGR